LSGLAPGYTHIAALKSADRSGVLFLLERAPAFARIVREEREICGMQNGTIKKLVSDRGFGFIAAEDGKEYFFHRSGTEGNFDALQGGEKVTFEVEPSPKGPRAGRVRVA
jgi:CspA family cold shock protein